MGSPFRIFELGKQAKNGSIWIIHFRFWPIMTLSSWMNDFVSSSMIRLLLMHMMFAWLLGDAFVRWFYRWDEFLPKNTFFVLLLLFSKFLRLGIMNLKTEGRILDWYVLLRHANGSNDQWLHELYRTKLVWMYSKEVLLLSCSFKLTDRLWSRKCVKSIKSTLTKLLGNAGARPLLLSCCQTVESSCQNYCQMLGLFKFRCASPCC